MNRPTHRGRPRFARLRLRLRMSLATLRAGGSRALLAVAAVGLGIAATTLSLAISAGARRQMDDLSARVGRDLLQVVPGRRITPPGRGRGWYTSRRLDREDGESIAASVPAVSAVVPVLEAPRRVRRGSETTVTTARGVTPDYLDLYRLELAEGRPFGDSHDRERRRVALVGSRVADRLGGAQPGSGLVGSTLRIGSVPFEVLGVLAERGTSPDGQSEDDQVLVPFETARRRLFGRESVSRLVVQAEATARLPAAEHGVRELLRRRHHLDPAAGDDFEIVPMIRTSEIRSRSQAFLGGLADLFATTTLLLGATGVLAVTLLNVRERRTEIGLRRAVGARRRDVAALFLEEACLLSLTGGVAGLAAGAGGAALLERLLEWRIALEPAGFAWPLGLSALIGVAAGVAPAWIAARRTPIDALRDA